MDPFDTALNGEGSASSGRRMSSILKVPRKSYIVPQPEQQETRVECVKTVEKRISRRVSFAATNDVLLFSDDAKSDASGKSPLQDLMTTAAEPQRRTQVALSEDLGHKAAKETLRRASLRTSESWDKVNFDTKDLIGDKTVMFGSDDAFMDMTQSHSVHLAADAAFLPDISVHNNELANREKTQIFSADDGLMDMTLNHTSRMVGVPEFPTSLECRMEKKRQSSSVSCLDPDFENFLSTLFKPHGSSANPEDARATTAGTLSEETNVSLPQIKAAKCDVDKENQPPPRSFSASRKRDPSSGSGTMDVTRAGDESMDMTQSHTVTVSGGLPVPSAHGKIGHISTQEGNQMGSLCISSTKCTDFGFKFSAAGVSTTILPDSRLLGSSSDPARTKTSSISFLSRSDGRAFQTSSGSGGGGGPEDDDVAMDMTEVPTRFIRGWNKDKFFPQFQNQKEQEIPEKVSLTANSAVMDVLLEPALDVKIRQHKFDAEDLVFSGADACMDVTESCTGRIATDFAAEQDRIAQSWDVKKMDQTLGQRCSLALRTPSYQGAETMSAPLKSKVDQVRLNGDEKTQRFTADDACMDMTQCQTVNIAKAPDSEVQLNSDLLSDFRDKTVTFSANAADMDVTQCLTGKIATGHILDAMSTHVDRTVTISADMNMTQCDIDNVPSHWSTTSVGQKRDSNFLPSCHEQNVSFFSKSSQDGSDCPPGNRPSTGRALNPGFKSLSKRSSAWANPVIVKAAPATLASVHSEDTQVEDDIAVKRELSTLVPAAPHSLEGVTRENLSEEVVAKVQYNSTPAPEHSDEVPRCALPPQSSPEQVRSSDCVAHSPESKRMSLADLQSKVRRLSQMVHAAPGHTAPLPSLEMYSKEETEELALASGECGGDTQVNDSMEEDQSIAASATPFKVKGAELVSRLSMGEFKPRLPKRGKSNDAQKAPPIEGPPGTFTPGAACKLPGIDCNVSDLYDEELGSCEDMSEMLEKDSPSAAGNEVFSQCHTSENKVKKRPLTSDEEQEEQKKRRTSTEMAANIDMSHRGESDTNMAPARCTVSHPTDESNSSQTGSGRNESTFESTLKQSLFESHFEDYADDMQTKFDEGTITVREFFKIFNIDFVIHSPRQSILPDRLSDSKCTPIDLLKDRYICRPKQLVYDSDIRSLTQKVDGLMGRLQDLDRPLQIVNRSLWEEISSFSEEELKSFGAKLKEQYSLFRKRSKAQSHEMKEVLYSNIVQANVEAQQSLRGKIDEADEMIKDLDDCIATIKTELTAVQEKGSEDLPSLKWCREETERVTLALADSERQTAEVEIQNEQNVKKLDKLKTETKDLQSHISTLHLLIEWRVGEHSDNSVTFTFLYNTFHLQVLYQDENLDDKQSERKIIDISFKHQIDEEKTKDYGRLVHTLLSQHVEGACAWLDKYPTSRHVPMLLQDVSLAVSSCRLLGEELRLLNTWGFMSFAILSITCVETRVQFVFSSLKNMAKFEVTFFPYLTEEAYALHVQSFKNKYGTTTIEKIEEIVASFTPCKKLLTKIVKKIHSSLLC